MTDTLREKLDAETIEVHYDNHGKVCRQLTRGAATALRAALDLERITINYDEIPAQVVCCADIEALRADVEKKP